jgi:hypothetical protein
MPMNFLAVFQIARKISGSHVSHQRCILLPVRMHLSAATAADSLR